MTTRDGCPLDEDLWPLAVDEPCNEAVRDHVAGCSSCQGRISRIRSGVAAIRAQVVESTAIGDAAPSLTADWDSPDPDASTADAPTNGEAGRSARPASIGKYMVIGELDEGGQAVVYRVVHRELLKQLVLKRAKKPLEGPADRDALVAEGRLLVELDHPAMVRIFDLDFDDGRPYLVMEYVPGMNLRQWAEQNRPSPRQAALMVAQLARAAGVAHSRGVFHCDIKPKNALVDQNGRPRLIDFGMARLRDAWSDNDDGPQGGTVAFMSPEQARGQRDRIGQSADVFALGSVLYYLLSDKAPYSGQTQREVLGRAMKCDFDREALGSSGVPSRLEQTCLKALPENHPDIAMIYSNLANCLRAQSKVFEAEALIRQALAIQLKALPEGHPEVAKSYINLANCLHYQGKVSEAEALYRQALAIQLKALPQNHPDFTESYYNLANCLQAQGKTDEAETYLLKAAETFDKSRLAVSFGGLGRASLSLVNPHFSLAALLARRGESDQAWHHFESSRARGLLDEVSARWARPLTLAERGREQESIAELHSVDEQITSNWRDVSGEARDRCSQELQRRRADLQARWGEFEVGLSEKYGAVAGQVYDLARIQSSLPEDVALVAWLDLGHSVGRVDREHRAWLVRRRGGVTWVELPGGGTHNAWTQDDRKLPAQAYPQLSARPDDQIGGWRETATRLAAQRLDPLDRLLGSRPGEPPIRHLIVLPSSMLGGLPIEALVEARPAGKPRYTVCYAPSGTMLTWLREQSAARRRSGPPRLLALGDPAFEISAPESAPTPAPDHGVLVVQVVPNSNADRGGIREGDVIVTCAGKPVDETAALNPLIRPGADVRLTLWRDGKDVEVVVPPGPLGFKIDCRPPAALIASQREADKVQRGSRGAKLERLPRTRDEVQAIAGLFADSTLLLGDQASERMLAGLAEADALKGYSHLLLATHGQMDKQIALNSRLFLVGDRDDDPSRAIVEGRPVFDGELTAQDMLGWKLDADLVTLSACETGLGKFSHGEGYLGFTQSLFVAGARSVVLSLWKVDDRATSLLMVRFHQNLLGRRDGLTKPMSKAESLREAKEWLRGLTVEEVDEMTSGDRGDIRIRKTAAPAPDPTARPRPPGRYAHPYYWAAFILVGDPS
jgi:serine/threonine protein kinase